MNTGTKIRTIVSILAAINIILIVFGVISFENQIVDMIYKIISSAGILVFWAVSHYFNNDFTEEAAESTGYARLRKESKGIVVGENFFDEAEDELDEDEEGSEQNA